MKTGHLFERALEEAGMDLKPGIQFKVDVKGKRGKFRLVVNRTDLSPFEASILERSRNAEQRAKPYRPNITVGERVCILRKSLGLTLDQLAKKAKISKGSLGSIERGNRSTGLLVLRRIARALRVPVTHLIQP